MLATIDLLTRVILGLSVDEDHMLQMILNLGMMMLMVGCHEWPMSIVGDLVGMDRVQQCAFFSHYKDSGLCNLKHELFL